MNAIHESVLVLQKVCSDHKEAFPEAPKRQFGSPGYSTLLLHLIWTAFFDRRLAKLPTGEYISPQYGGSWTLESWEDQFCRDVHQDLCQYAEMQHVRVSAVVSPEQPHKFVLWIV